MTLRELLERGVKRAGGTQRGLAIAIDLSETYISRVIRGIEPSIGLGPLLRLARLLELPPTDVLAIANKAADAELILEMFGPERRLTAAQQQLVEAAAALPADDVRRVVHFAAALAETAGQRPGESRRVRDGRPPRRSRAI